MMTTKIYNGEYRGVKVSNYGKEHGYIDYRTLDLATTRGGILANGLFEYLCNVASLEPEILGVIDNSERLEEIEGYIDTLDGIESDLQDAIDKLDDVIDGLNYMDEFDEDGREIAFCTYTLETERDDLISTLEQCREFLDEYRNEYDDLEDEDNAGGEIFQYYIVNDWETLVDAGEVVYKFDVNGDDLYIWGVRHYGTAWDYVLTDIAIEPDDEETATESDDNGNGGAE